MTFNEAFQELKRLRSLITAGGDDSVFSTEDKQTIEELYKSEVGKEVRQCNCKDKYADAVLEIYRTLKQRATMKAEQKYQLKAGILVWIGTDVYNHLTLTDELAEIYLQAHPDAVKDFIRVPEPSAEAETTEAEASTETEPTAEKKKTSRKTSK